MAAVTAEQNKAVGTALIVGGGLVLLAGLGVALLYVAGNLLISIVAVFGAFLGLRTFNRGRRHFVPIGLESIADDPRPPVLYLRPFHYDSLDFQISPAAVNRGFSERGAWRQIGVVVRLIRTNEQLLARGFRRIGPLVTFGDPRESLPRLGAVRLYVREGPEWRTIVSELAARAGYVILEIGISDSMLWEVDFVTDRVPPERLILSLGNDRKAARRMMRPSTRERRRLDKYAAFRQTSAQVFPRPLPERLGACRFIYFEPDWTPRRSVFVSERVPPFGRRARHPEDPKLEALAWLNSVQS